MNMTPHCAVCTLNPILRYLFDKFNNFFSDCDFNFSKGCELRFFSEQAKWKKDFQVMIKYPKWTLYSMKYFILK